MWKGAGGAAATVVDQSLPPTYRQGSPLVYIFLGYAGYSQQAWGLLSYAVSSCIGYACGADSENPGVSRKFCQLMKTNIVTRQRGMLPWSTLALRQPAPYPSSPPNTRIAATSLDGRWTRIADAIASGRGGPRGPYGDRKRCARPGNLHPCRVVSHAWPHHNSLINLTQVVT